MSCVFRLGRLAAPPSDRQPFLLSLPAPPRGTCCILSRARLFLPGLLQSSQGQSLFSWREEGSHGARLPCAGPAPFSLPFSLGAQAVVVHSRQLWLRWMAQGVWSRACHTRRGPPPSLALFCLSGGARAPAHTMEAARMPRGSAGWFPSFAASIKRQTADVPACQRHRWRARRTSRVASTASLGLPNGLSNRICVVIKKGLLSFVGPCFASRSSHTIVWSSISHLVRSSPGFRSRPLPANRRQGLTSGQQAAAVTRLDSVRPVLTPAVHQTV